jgi:hypothetical protein
MKFVHYFLALLFISNAIAETSRRCATIQLLNQPKQAYFRQTSSSCSAESYYDSVSIRTTEHFALIYTKTGPHATTSTFLDSLEHSLENAYKRYTQTHKTLPPLGVKTSWHYQKNIPNNLYPVEVVELDLLRNIQNLIGENNCQYCMAITVPSFSNDGSSSIIIDNDFKHSSPQATTGFFSKDSNSCEYSIADFAIKNYTHNYSYAKKFGSGIRVTIYHELYHAIQLRYLDLLEYPTYWFEASASGIEEITAPDIDDYLTFSNQLASMQWESFSNVSNPYALAPYYLNLYQNFGPTFDTKIWKEYKKNPNATLEKNIASILQTKKINPDSLFHQFAHQYFFSGNRTLFAPKEIQLQNDAALWETPKIHPEQITIPSNSQPYFSYRFSSHYPEFSGTKSYLLKNKNDYTYAILPIHSHNEYLKNYSKIQSADSVVLVLSRFLPTKLESEENIKQKLLVYPNPYKGGVPLCFTGLPSTSGVLEIRNRRGSLIVSKKYEGNQFCFQESEIKQILTPGLYYYRDGRNGKLKKFIYQ